MANTAPTPKAVAIVLVPVLVLMLAFAFLILVLVAWTVLGTLLALGGRIMDPADTGTAAAAGAAV